MSKKTIAMFLIPAIVLTIVGEVLSYTQTAATIGLILTSIGGILSLVSWIGALVATGKQGRWGWFVCILLLSWILWIVEVIYLFAGPDVAAKTAQPVQNLG